jgi:hypothetical protein
MKPQGPKVSTMKKQILSREPESIQKYSDEMRELIAKKAYELYEQRGRQTERDVADWLEAEELVRKEAMIGGQV